MNADLREQSVRGGWRNDASAHRVSLDEEATPLISVVTVVWNGAATLDACIQSVLNQSHRNVEHVIIDGGSTDGTLDILRKYDKDIAYWVSEKDAGIYDALNKGVRAANGRYYVPLGCDDTMTVDGAAAFARSLGSSDIVYAQVRFERHGQPARLIRNHSAGVAISRKAHLRWGFYDTTYRIAADTKFLALAKREGDVVYIDDVVGIFVAGGASGNYAQNIREHARAMRESGAWGVIRTFGWLAPRWARSLLMRSRTHA